MNKPNKIGIIGAGGIACALAPIITKQFDTVLVDADEYEPKNSTRQFPALTSTGNKAEVLRDMLQPSTLKNIQAIPRYLKNTTIANEPEWKGVDFIIGCVDNNASRRLIIEVADAYGIPAIIAGNEDRWGEAHLFIPDIYNPLDHHDFPETDAPPWACNSDQNLEENPQTWFANALASGCALHLLLSWVESPRERVCVAWSKTDVFSSEFKRVKHYVDLPFTAV